jgi:4-hydroxy-tetrahydrodipicolinate synthase
MHDVIRGLWAAVVTPLDPAGAVDRAVLVRHCQWLLASGCDGVALFSTIGEGPSFAASERLASAEALLHAGIPASRVALGTGCPSVADTVGLTRGALVLGLTHVLILPPYFFRDATEPGLEDAFAAIIDGVASARLRATLDHIPHVSGVAVPAGALGRLRDRFGALIAGVHDGSFMSRGMARHDGSGAHNGTGRQDRSGAGDPTGGQDGTDDLVAFRAFRAAAPACGVLVGAEGDIARALALGGTGTICALANIVPGLVRAMFDTPPGEAAMRQAQALLNGPVSIPVLKSVLAARTGDGAWRAVRPPLRPADAITGARIAAALQARRAA